MLETLAARFPLYRLWPALIAGLVGAAASLVGSSFTGVTLFADLVTEASTFFLGPRGFSFLLREFGPNGKPLLFLGILAGQFTIYAVVSFLLAKKAAAPESEKSSDSSVLPPFWLQIGLVTAIFLGISIVLTTFGEAEISTRSAWAEHIMLTATVSFFYALTDRLYRMILGAASPPAETFASAINSRRSFLRLGAGGVLAVGAMLIIGRRVVGTAGGGVQRSRRGEQTSEITSNDDFYRVSKNLVDPRVNEARWSLSVSGLTERDLLFNYQDILAMESEDFSATLQCISNEVGGELIGNAIWTGFRLNTLIERAGPLPSAKFVAFRAHDNYTESLPLDFALRDEIMLAHSMNGEVLPHAHGFPLRMVTPGKYGIKNPKWLTEIALVENEFFGFWEQRGWSQEARMNTSCRIDSPIRSQIVDSSGPVLIHGIAFSGSRGINRVEVSTDGGQSWNNATLTRPLSPYSWVLWHYDWDQERTEGRVEIVARATDGEGEVQPVEERPPEPSGATGYPRVSVRVPAKSA